MQPGRVIHHYQLSHILGIGGMGEVWAAIHLHNGKMVAIKSLLSAYLRNAEIRSRFKQEALTMLNLQHPNIVRIVDFVEEPEGMHLVMEYVEGISIDQYIQRKTGPIPEEQAISLFSQILEGLQYAHNLGIIHRDIKPCNFMVTPQRLVKILDFGIAKVAEGAGNMHTKTGSRMGTAYYMSPEQVNGQPIDFRSDIYSLGITLFQMLTGKCPFPSTLTEYEVYHKILHEKLPRAATFYPAVSPKMQAIIEKATEKRKQDRFQNCDEFLAALVPAHKPIIGKAKEKTLNPPPPKNRRKRKSWIWVLGLLLLATGIWLLYPKIQQEPIQYEPMETPKNIAFNFLTAIENDDSTTAIKYATPECKEEIKLLFFVKSRKKGRKVTILHSSGYENVISIHYRLDDSSSIKYLPLKQIRNSWRVNCKKTELGMENDPNLREGIGLNLLSLKL